MEEELLVSDFLKGDVATLKEGMKFNKINSDVIGILLQRQNYTFLARFLDVQSSERSVTVNLFMNKNSRNVSQFLSFLSHYTEGFTSLEHGLGFIGEGLEMFHLVKCRNLDNRSLLEHIVDFKMIKQREELLDVLDKIDRARYPAQRSGSKKRLTEQLKAGLPSSEGLVSCLQSLHLRYRWTRGKIGGRQLKSIFKNILIGWTMFFLDLGTDIVFTSNMYWNSLRDCHQEVKQCKMDFLRMVNHVPDHCNTTATFFQCQELLENVSLSGLACYDDAVCRFEDPDQWRVMMFVSLAHCILPILFSLTVFLIVERESLHKVYNIPNPCITKFHRALLEFKLYRRLGKEEFIDREHIERLETNENYVVMSMIIEAVTESSFQFYFQTIFMIPVVIANILDLQNIQLLTDLFNWRTLSIAISFITISWSFYHIRNTEKRGALSNLNLVIVTLKFTLDAVSRILIFSRSLSSYFRYYY